MYRLKAKLIQEDREYKNHVLLKLYLNKKKEK